MDKQRILVVDDEEDLREILKFNLESEGYWVDTAPSAEQALKMLTEGYDLILLDVMMGGMSGFKMAEKLRKDLHDSTPIIFLTAKDTENDMLTGFNIGGDDYISKPFSRRSSSGCAPSCTRSCGTKTSPTSRCATSCLSLIHICCRAGWRSGGCRHRARRKSPPPHCNAPYCAPP